MQVATFIVSIVSIILSIVSIVLGCLSISMIIGLKNSTHSIQYVPVDDVPVDDLTNDLLESQRRKKPRTDIDIEDIYEHT